MYITVENVSYTQKTTHIKRIHNDFQEIFQAKIYKFPLLLRLLKPKYK